MLASYFLKEKQNLHVKIGCFLSIIGSIVLVIHAPQEEEVKSMDTLEPKLTSPGVYFFFMTNVNPFTLRSQNKFFLTVCYNGRHGGQMISALNSGLRSLGQDLVGLDLCSVSWAKHLTLTLPSLLRSRNYSQQIVRVA